MSDKNNPDQTADGAARAHRSARITEGSDREARLAAALRANLQRRKQQRRARQDQADDDAGGSSGTPKRP